MTGANKICPDISICKAGDACAGWCKPAPAVASPPIIPKEHQGCYPGCFYYTDSCFRSDCKKAKELS